MSLENKIKEVLEKIETARKSSPFNQKVDLIAATKTRDISQIQDCYKLGVLNIGENRVQEAEKKFVDFPGFNQLKRNETPTYEMLSGAAIAFAALLLILPGFATDIIGILLVFPITRKIIYSILDGTINNSNFEVDPYFGVQVPLKLGEIDSSILIPLNAWNSKEGYEKTAEKIII